MSQLNQMLMELLLGQPQAQLPGGGMGRVMAPPPGGLNMGPGMIPPPPMPQGAGPMQPPGGMPFGAPAPTPQIGMGRAMPPMPGQAGPQMGPGMQMMPTVNGPNKDITSRLEPPPGGPMTVGTPPAGAPAAPAPQAPMPQPGFRQQAAGLFGNGGKTLYQILADTMAGVAGADPTAPALKAFAQGAHGAAGEGKKRTDAKTAADDKTYEREGKDLERQNLRQTMEQDRVKGRDMHLKTLFEIANLASGGDPNKFRQSLQQSAFRGGIPIDEATLDEQTKMAFPQWQGGAKGQGQGGWTPQSGSAPPKGHREPHNSDPNKWIEWDGTQWIDQDGNPVPTS